MKKRLKYNKHNPSINWQRLKEYFSNELSDKESNEVERYLLSDPFNADAAEGFESNAPASLDTDINNIKKRIERKTGYYPIKQKVPISINYRMIAAASVIIVAGLAIIYFTFNSDKLQNAEVAQNIESKDRKVTSNIVNEEDTKSTEEFIETIDEEITAYDIEEKHSAEIPPQKGQTLATPPQKEELLEMAAISLTEKIEKKSALDVMEEVNNVVFDFEEEVLDETVVLDTVEVFKEVQTLATSAAVNIKIDKKELVMKESQLPVTDSTQPKSEQAKVQQSAVAAMPTKPSEEYIGSIKSKIKERYSDIEGIFEVWFNVEADGSLSEFDVTKSISRRIDRRILREIEDAGKWNPAYLNSNPVQSRSTLSINFNE